MKNVGMKNNSISSFCGGLAAGFIFSIAIDMFPFLAAASIGAVLLAYEDGGIGWILMILSGIVFLVLSVGFPIFIGNSVFEILYKKGVMLAPCLGMTLVIAIDMAAFTTASMKFFSGSAMNIFLPVAAACFLILSAISFGFRIMIARKCQKGIC